MLSFTIDWFFLRFSYVRESKTRKRSFLKKSAKDYKDFRQLSKKEFSCEKDAEKSLSLSSK